MSLKALRAKLGGKKITSAALKGLRIRVTPKKRKRRKKRRRRR